MNGSCGKKNDGLGPAKTLTLAALVGYADGAIVSKTLLERDVGTVTLFAFDQGQGLSEHSAPFDALVQVIDGEATVVIAGESHQLKSGEIIVMPADVPHAVKAKARFKMLLTMLKS